MRKEFRRCTPGCAISSEPPSTPPSLRSAAIAAMNDERLWAPGKAMLAAAMRDGVDPADLAAVWRHALERGLAADYVDELLPPGPAWAGTRWLRLVE